VDSRICSSRMVPRRMWSITGATWPTLVRHLLLAYFTTLFPYLNVHLMPLPLVFDTESQNCEVVSVWTMARYAWGRKLLSDGTSSPHIPVPEPVYSPVPPHLGGQTPPHDPSGPYGKYPLAHYYPTAESARQWMEWRAMERARLGYEPWPHVVPWQ